MRIALCLSLLLLLSGSGFADDSGLWAQIDAKVGQTPLCDAFVDGASYTFHHRECTSMGCDEWDYVVKTFCSAGVARIENWKAGQEFSQSSVAEADWAAIHGNLLRDKAQSAESYGGVFSLDRVEASDGLLKASYTIRFGSKVVEQGFWLIGDGPAAVPQIQERSSTQFGIFQETDVDTLSKP